MTEEFNITKSGAAIIGSLLLILFSVVGAASVTTVKYVSSTQIEAHDTNPDSHLIMQRDILREIKKNQKAESDRVIKALK